MRSVELFSGCGGLALGTALAGFHHARMVEWDADAFATLALNQRNDVAHARDWRVSREDVRSIDWSETKGDIALVAGGPPCQPFSIGGKHSGKADRRDMWPEAVRAVRELDPQAFLFENVLGLARPAFAEYLDWIKLCLANPGSRRGDGEDHADHLARLRVLKTGARYDVTFLKVNAADFGAAQKRRRVVLAGFRKDLGLAPTPPTPTHSRARLLWDQWVDGSYWRRHAMTPPIKGPRAADRKLVETLRAAPPELAWRTIRDALVGLGEPDGVAGHRFQPGARAYPGHTGGPLDEPAKALKAGDHGVPGGENMMVKDDGSVRYFTLREAARLQGLPDQWRFAGSWSERMRQLGNAVPVPLARALGDWIAETLTRAQLARRAA